MALNPMDEAKGYAQLRTLGKTAQQVARICGVSTATVYTRLALLDLPKAEQQQVETGALPLAQAGEVAKLIRRREAGAVRHQREPAHFTSRHHLWAAVKLTCTHRAERPVIGGAGCAQCWEAAIREDERNRIRGR